MIDTMGLFVTLFLLFQTVGTTYQLSDTRFRTSSSRGAEEGGAPETKIADERFYK